MVEASHVRGTNNGHAIHEVSAMMKKSLWRWIALPAIVAGLFCLPGALQAADHHHRDGWHGRVRHVEHVRYAHPRVWVHGPIAYRHDYFLRFRPGFRSIIIGPSTFYYYSALPVGYQTVVVNGQTFYLSAGVYYQPYPYAGGTIYLVVPPPV
jgi:hypothetical protein